MHRPSRNLALARSGRGSSGFPAGPRPLRTRPAPRDRHRRPARRGRSRRLHGPCAVREPRSHGGAHGQYRVRIARRHPPPPRRDNRPPRATRHQGGADRHRGRADPPRRPPNRQAPWLRRPSRPSRGRPRRPRTAGTAPGPPSAATASARRAQATPGPGAGTGLGRPRPPRRRRSRPRPRRRAQETTASRDGRTCAAGGVPIGSVAKRNAKEPSPCR